MLSSAEQFRVLIVEDDQQMLRTLEDILRLRGYASLGAPSAEQGLELTRSALVPPAIALIDLGLPGMDGLELVSAVRKISPATEVVILTGNASVESAIRALRESSYDYLIKPVQPERLLNSIERAGERWHRRRAEAAMQESEKRLRRIFEHVSDALFITGDAGVITDANPAAAELTGRPLEELCAGSWTIADLFGVEGPAGEAAGSGWSAPNRVHEFRLQRANGDVRIVDVRAAKFAPERVVHTVRDLTNERRLEEELNHSQRMEAIGRLAGGVAHDFNNVLTTISCVSQLVIETLAQSDERRADLQEILTASRRAAGLTRQLLAFSRRQILQPRVLNVAEVVRDMDRMLGRLIGADVQLTAIVERDLWAVRADAGQLEQVIMNLVVNARDAMPNGGQLTIRAANVTIQSPRSHEGGVLEAGEYVLLRVADTGCGMDAATRARMFEPFFTTKPAGMGTGLGLSTVYGVVKQSGGQLMVESAPGAGTTFFIYLPREESVPVPESPRAPIPGVAQQRATVLLVEDDTTIRSLARRILVASGYAVMDAASGARALALAKESATPIDLLLADVVLSDTSGRQLADRLLTVQPGARVLYMSGYTDDAAIHPDTPDSSRGLLVKPFTANELTNKVHEVLSRPEHMPKVSE
jgi:PAS domain S-box-containing protein